MSIHRGLLLSIAVATCLAAGCAIGKPPAKSERPMVPHEVKIPLPSLHRTLVFSAPAYVSTSVEDTPYQWLQICDESGAACRTLLDSRGKDAISMPANKSLGLSPDGRYLLCVRMTGVNVPDKTYRSQYYQLYDLAAGKQVTFNTNAGKTATTDNIGGWAEGQPHALEVSTGFDETALAFPPGEN